MRTSARVEKLFEGTRWAEGPAYFAAGRYLVWSDIPNDRILRWDEPTGNVGVFRSPAGYTNGHTVDREGRLVSCSHGARRVERTEHDGSITVIADRYRGQAPQQPQRRRRRAPTARSGSPTPPTASTATTRATRPRARSAPPTSTASTRGSGTCRDRGRRLRAPQRPGLLARRAAPLRLGHGRSPTSPTARATSAPSTSGADGALSGGEVFATCTEGIFDGFRFDADGRLWTSAGDGVHCYDPDGTLLGKVLVPEAVANVVFGGPKRNRLFICATTSLYSVMLGVSGATRP